MMAEYEVQTYRQFDRVVWVSQKDLEGVSSIADLPRRMNRIAADYKVLSKNNSIIPICVDAVETAPVDRVPETDEILFVGGMHWPPNVDGVIWSSMEVLPLVKEERPHACFVVVGKQPPEAIKAMGKQMIAPGYVNNIDRYWAIARVFVVPLRAGGGMRVQILDVWSRGIQIVSTTMGAEVITYQPGRDRLIVVTAEYFALVVQKIFTDDNLARLLSHSDRRTLEDCYNWRKIYSAWDVIYGCRLPPGSLIKFSL